MSKYVTIGIRVSRATMAGLRKRAKAKRVSVEELAARVIHQVVAGRMIEKAVR